MEGLMLFVFTLILLRQTCQPQFVQCISSRHQKMQEPQKGLGTINDEEYQPSLAESNVRSVISHSSYKSLDKIFKQYTLRSPLIDIERLKASPHLTIKKYRQSAYYGELSNKRRHGQGIMIYNNDRLYEGNWENDYKHGPGYQVFPTGSIYQGNYVNGRPEGVGKYHWPNGQFYQGQWLGGLKHGSGMWQGAKGDSYVGEWRMGKADGYGVHVWVNGDRYEGQFKNCLKHGQGTEKFANGDLYKGTYSKGKPDGYGQYYWANGSYFKGNFKEGLREGHGMWKKGSGVSDKYEGQYKADKKHGYGIFSWASGNVYKGNYEEDLRTGYGEMYWGDGSYYKGDWVKGIQDGQGILYVPGQSIKRGKFQDNVLVQIYEEQAPFNPPQQSIPYVPRPGSIKKANNTYLPPNIEQKNNFRSVDTKRKVLSVYEHPQKQSNVRVIRELHPLAPKKVNKTTHTAELQRASTNVGNARSKDRIPHSAFYMHKLHKRVSTAHNDDKSFQQPKNKADIVDELRNFTKKMVGRRPN